MLPIKINKYAMLCLLSLIWGSQFVFNDLALKDFTFLWIATLRAGIGALTLIVILFLFPLQKNTEKRPPSYYLPLIILIGALDATIPFSLLTWGQQQVNSSIAAILIGTVPIFTAVFASIFLKKENLHIGTVLAIIFGFCGIITLVAPELHGALATIYRDMLGELAILGGAISFAASLTLMRLLPVHPLRAARDILIAGTLELTIITLIFEKSLPHFLHTSSIFALLSIGILGTGVVYVFFVVLVQKAGSTFASFGNYLVPLVGVLFGTVFLHIPVTKNQIIALSLIIIGLLLNGYISHRLSNKTVVSLE